MNDAETDDERRLRSSLEQREESIRKKLKAWGPLSRDDYDFPWARALSTPDGKSRAVPLWKRERLFAAALYEYARESRRLRGLLLLECRRKRARWEREAGSSFEGLTPYAAEERLGSHYFFLRELGRELAANFPFGSVPAPRVDAALACKRQHETLGTHFINQPLVRPAHDNLHDCASAELALLDITEFVENPATGEVVERERERVFQKDRNGNPCEEVLMLSVNWRDASDDDLAEAFKDFCSTYRPRKEFPGHGKRGKGSAVHYCKGLDALSALRLASAYPMGAWSAHAPPADSAIARFLKSRLNGSAAELYDESELHKLRREALRTFDFLFGFPSAKAEMPEHGMTRAARRKVGRK